MQIHRHSIEKPHSHKTTASLLAAAALLLDGGTVGQTAQLHSADHIPTPKSTHEDPLTAGVGGLVLIKLIEAWNKLLSKGMIKQPAPEGTGSTSTYDATRDLTYTANKDQGAKLLEAIAAMSRINPNERTEDFHKHVTTIYAGAKAQSHLPDYQEVVKLIENNNLIFMRPEQTSPETYVDNVLKAKAKTLVLKLKNAIDTYQEAVKLKEEHASPQNDTYENLDKLADRLLKEGDKTLEAKDKQELRNKAWSDGLADKLPELASKALDVKFTSDSLTEDGLLNLDQPITLFFRTNIFRPEEEFSTTYDVCSYTISYNGLKELLENKDELLNVSAAAADARTLQMG